ncbi:MAG: flagellar hook-basal body complex protein [Planctomycetes bacterium]|nr:flagellar hook-basal body complex protein [Planctomycetota bacterium]
MALIRSLNTAVTGLRGQQRNIEVIGDNIANVETTGFKSTRAEFKTLLSQVLSFGTSPDGQLAGSNPKAVGLGSEVAATSRNFSQGSLESTGVATDLAIEGEGFFILKDERGKNIFTRDGSFAVSSQQLLFDEATGFKVQGLQLTDAEILAGVRVATKGGTTTTDLRVPVGDLRIARASAGTSVRGNVDAGGDAADEATRLLGQQLFDAEKERQTITAVSADLKTLTLGTAFTGAQVGDFVRVADGVARERVGRIAAVDATARTVTLAAPLATNPGTGVGLALVAPASEGTPLTRLRLSDGGQPSPQFTQVFQAGQTVSFTARKGGRTLPATTFVVNQNSSQGLATLGEFAKFLQRSLGINAEAGVPASFQRIAPGRLLVGDGVATTAPAPAERIDPAVSGTADAVSSTTISDHNLIVGGALSTFAARGVAAGDLVVITSGPAAGKVVRVTALSADGKTLTYANTGLPANALPLTNSDTLGGAFGYRVVRAATFAAGGALTAATDVVGTAALPADIDTQPDVATTTSITDNDLDFAAAGVRPGDFLNIVTGAGAGQKVQILAVSGHTIQFEALSLDPDAGASAANPFIEYSIERANGPVRGRVDALDTATTAFLKDLDVDFQQGGVRAGTGGDFLRFTSGEANGLMTPITVLGDSVTNLPDRNRLEFSPIVRAARLGDDYQVHARAGVTLTPGGVLQVAGNLGALNDLAELKVEVDGQRVDLFTAAALSSARGESARGGLMVFDGKGKAHEVTLTFVLESQRTDGPSTWRWYAESDDHTPTGTDGVRRPSRFVATDTIQFTRDGRFILPATAQSFTLQLPDTGVQPVTVALDFSRMSQFAGRPSELEQLDQDGFEEGTLQGFHIGKDGVVSGTFSNGLTRDMGQVLLAGFPNNGGLLPEGDSVFRQGINSGAARVGAPGSFGRGVIQSGFLEESNVDLSQQFTELIVGQRAFQANARTISVSDDMLQELVNLI